MTLLCRFPPLFSMINTRQILGLLCLWFLQVTKGQTEKKQAKRSKVKVCDGYKEVDSPSSHESSCS